MPKTKRELAREVDEFLAPSGAKAEKSKEWSDGFKFGSEAARDEWSRYGRADVKVTLDQLRAYARNDFDLGQVAGYENVLNGQTERVTELAGKIELLGKILAARRPKRGGDVEVDASLYRRYHGVEPRGRADWTFVIGKLDQGGKDDPALYRPARDRGAADLPYSKARDFAIAEARRRGASLVGVGV